MRSVWVIIADTGGGSDNYLENTTVVEIKDAEDLFSETVINCYDVRFRESREMISEGIEEDRIYYICEDEVDAVLRRRWFENQVLEEDKPYAVPTDPHETKWLTFQEVTDYLEERRDAESR